MATQPQNLTLDQLKQQIDSMQSSGKSTQDIQSFVDTYKKNADGSFSLKSVGTTNSPLTNFVEGMIPAAGATIGAIGGGALGGLVASPTIAGIPAGVIAGSAAGAAGGAAIGTALKDKVQNTPINANEVVNNAVGYGALEAIGGPAASLVGKGLEVVGKKAATAMVPKTIEEAGRVQNALAKMSFPQRIGSWIDMGSKKIPETGADVAFKRGIMGTETMMGVGAKKAQNNIWNKAIQPALKGSADKVYMPSFFKDAAKRIVRENADLTRRNSLLKALDSIKEDFGKVGGVNLLKLQSYKEGWAAPVPQKAYRGEEISNAANDVRNTLAQMARERIYSSLGKEVKQAYLDYSNLSSIVQLGKKAGMGAFKGVNTIGHLLEMTAVPVGTVSGQVVYRVGQGLELIGKPGARVLRDILELPSAGVVQSLGGPTQTGGVPATEVAPQAQTAPPGVGNTQ